MTHYRNRTMVALFIALIGVIMMFSAILFLNTIDLYQGLKAFAGMTLFCVGMLFVTERIRQ